MTAAELRGLMETAGRELWSACSFEAHEMRFPHVHLDAVAPEVCRADKGLPNYIVVNECASMAECIATAELISAMRNALPALLAVVEAAQTVSPQAMPHALKIALAPFAPTPGDAS